jgi:hypothetical protein
MEGNVKREKELLLVGGLIALTVFLGVITHRQLKKKGISLRIGS